LSGPLARARWLALALSMVPACQEAAPGAPPGPYHASSVQRAGARPAEQRSARAAAGTRSAGDPSPHQRAAQHARVRLPRAADRTSPPPPPALSPALSRPGAARVVAIGDLHGDLAAARAALQLA